MSLVAIRFAPLPAHVRTARLVASAVARRSGVADDVLDELRFAVGEACARAVDLHLRHVPDQPVVLELVDVPGRLEVTVVDRAPSGEQVADPAAGEIGSGVFDPDAIATPVPRQPVDTVRDPSVDFLPAGFGLAVIQGLVDDVDVVAGADGTGTRVRMSWSLPAVAPPGG